MAHEIDMTTGKAGFAYVGLPGWHGLGSRIEVDTPLPEAQRIAGLNWTAERAPVYYDDGGDLHRMTDKRVLFRSDTKAPLSLVSDSYRVVQPADIINFFDVITKKIGGFKIETLGSLKGGRRVWALANCEDVIRLSGADKIKRYLLVSTSYDLSYETVIKQTSTRVVCNNTLEMAFGETRKEIRIPHSTTFSPDAVLLRAGFDEEWAGFMDAVELLAEKKMDDLSVKGFLHQVFIGEDGPKGADAILRATTETEEDRKAREKSEERLLARLMDIYRGAPGQDLPTAKGTAWGALHAVTFKVDHETRERIKGNRLERAWFGDGQTKKNRALKLAMSL